MFSAPFLAFITGLCKDWEKNSGYSSCNRLELTPFLSNGFPLIVTAPTPNGYIVLGILPVTIN